MLGGTLLTLQTLGIEIHLEQKAERSHRGGEQICLKELQGRARVSVTGTGRQFCWQAYPAVVADVLASCIHLALGKRSLDGQIVPGAHHGNGVGDLVIVSAKKGA